MTARIVEDSFKTTVAKSFYNYVKGTILGDSLYASVIYLDPTEYVAYSGTSSDSDSESEFFGGTVLGGFDERDKAYYSQNTISMHKIFAGGVSRIVKRVDWEPNKKFESWPAAESHVLVKEFVSGYARLNVYRCVFSSNLNSTFAPSGVSSTEIYLPDGYVWKYLYTISNSESQRFLTDDWMPVPEAITEDEATNISSSSPRYNQYVVQENSVVGELFGFNIDSDLFTPYLATKGNSISVKGKTRGGQTPTQEFSGTIALIDSEIKATLTQKGIGYTGLVYFVSSDSDEVEIPGLTGRVVSGRGHGTDAPSEMLAKNMMLVSRTVPDGNVLNVINNNKFNALGLIKNPVDISTNATAKKDFYITCKSFRVESPASIFVTGDFIQPYPTDDGRRGLVTSVKDNVVYYLSYIEGKETDTFLKNESVANPSGTKVERISEVFNRETTFDSGELIIFDKKENDLIRSSDQIETVSFILNF